MKMIKLKYKFVFFLSFLTILHSAYAQEEKSVKLDDQIAAKRNELRAALEDIPLNTDEYLTKSIEIWEALFQFKLDLKKTQCTHEKYKVEPFCTKTEAELQDSKKLTLCSVRAGHVWFQHLKLGKLDITNADDFQIRHDQGFLKENYKSDDAECSKIVAHEKKRIVTAKEDRDSTCQWSKAFPRRVVTLDGCGKSKTTFCTGHVLCGGGDGSPSEIKFVNCSPDSCDSSDPDQCLKDSKYNSQVYDGGVNDFSEQVKQMIASPTTK